MRKSKVTDFLRLRIIFHRIPLLGGLRPRLRRRVARHFGRCVTKTLSVEVGWELSTEVVV